MQIVAKDLSYVYSENSKALAHHALKGINLTIDEGEFFGIIGQTGSGKSTFVQHLNGLIRVQKDRGQLSVGEFDLTDKKCDLKALREKVGMVFQYPEYQLFAETVRDDVAFGLKNFEPSLSDERVENRVREALEDVGLDYERVKDKSPFELSGGQKRRVAIAGVIVTHPEVLVLDEPVAGLDPVGKKDFLALLHRLKEKFVKTIILVSHDMNVVSEHCTKVAVFSKGEIYGVGTPKEVFADHYALTLLGLDLPVTAFVEKELKKSRINVESDLTVDGLVKSILAVKGGMR